MQSRITGYKHIYLEFSIKYLYCHSGGQSGFIILFLLFASSDTHKCSCHHAWHGLPTLFTARAPARAAPVSSHLFHCRGCSKGLGALLVTTARTTTQMPGYKTAFSARDQCKSLHDRQRDIEGDTRALRHFQSCRRIQLFLHPGAGAVKVLLTLCADPSCIFPPGFFTRAIFMKITGSPQAPGKALIPILYLCLWGSPSGKEKTEKKNPITTTITIIIIMKKTILSEEPFSVL